MSARQFTLSAASHLTQHALQEDVLDAEHAFEAVHSRAGGTLMFFIGGGDVLSVAKEEAGRAHGWSRADLSSAQTRRDFPWGASCKRFAAVQGESGTIDLAMVLSDGSDDHLYLSLGNSDADTSWTDAPAWLPCPYNADFSTAPETMHIVKVMISDAGDRFEIVVDIVANPGDAAPMLRRYYLDLSTPSSPAWIAHAGGAGPALAGMSTCMGRAGGSAAPEGVYTLSSADGRRRLHYAHLRGQGGTLHLPGERGVDAIATCRHGDNATGLFFAARGALYYLAAGAGGNSAAVPLMQNRLFERVTSLRAVVAGDKVAVWALNADGELFYVSCASSQLHQADAWSHPLCTLAGVSAVSPYYDRLHGALVLLARTADGLVKLTKSPVTGLWNRRRITMPPSSLMQAARSAASYVTSIDVADAAGAAALQMPVMLSASSVTSVYINGLYRIVGPVPISVLTDAAGKLTIVEAVHGLAGARFEARAGDCSIAVNPMEQAFQTAAGMVDDLALAHAYRALAGQAPLAGVARPQAPAAFPDALHGDVGDLFSWLESGIAGSARIVHDAATGLWHVVATIGSQLFHGVLDCLEKIVAATLWVLGAVKTGAVLQAAPLSSAPCLVTPGPAAS